MEGKTEHCTNQPKLPNGNPNFPENLESMSADQIAQAMEDSLDHMTEETYDEAVISAYLDALDKKAPMPDMQSTDEAWAEFQKRFEDASLVVGAPSSKRPVRFRRLLRTGLVAAIVVVCLFGAMIVAQAAGIDVFGAVARWSEETFQFSVSEDETATAWFAGHQAELDAVGLSEEFLPTWIPEGYVVGDIQSYGFPEWIDIYIPFNGSENHSTFDILISIYNDPGVIGDAIFEKDSTDVQTFQVNGKNVYLFENLGVKNAVCQDQNVVYSIQGNLSQDEIQNILASIGG